MKNKVYGVGLAGLLAVMAGCSTPPQNSGLTTVNIVGPEGTTVTGHYVQDGRLVELTEVLPFTFAQKGISEFEVRKSDLSHPISLAAQYDDQLAHSEVLTEAGPGLSGVRLRVQEGVVAERLSW